MLIKMIYMFFSGYITLIVEGFFIERFINICMNKKIFLQDIKRENNTYLKVKILKSDFKEIRHIAKKTKCKIKIEKKSGLPFVMNKYRKRKVFAVAVLVIAIFIFTLTKFIWNIEVIGNENIPKEEIIFLAKEYGIDIGKLKSNINIEKISNEIRLKRDDLSWVGITVKGTNVIITVKEGIETPEIIDKNEVCNIIASKDATISKMVVQNGTARVNVGDEVNAGDLLVEGIMESEISDPRPVHAEADIYGKFYFEKEKKESFVQNEKVKTGNEEQKNEICINNFKINLYKRLSNFEKYDTIEEYKKLQLFSDFYLPFGLTKITNKEYNEKEIILQKEDAKNQAVNLAEEKINEQIKDKSKILNKQIKVNNTDEYIEVEVVYEVLETIETKEKIVF